MVQKEEEEEEAGNKIEFNRRHGTFFPSPRATFKIRLPFFSAALKTMTVGKKSEGETRQTYFKIN